MEYRNTIKRLSRGKSGNNHKSINSKNNCNNTRASSSKLTKYSSFVKFFNPKDETIATTTTPKTNSTKTLSRVPISVRDNLVDTKDPYSKLNDNDNVKRSSSSSLSDLDHKKRISSMTIKNYITSSNNTEICFNKNNNNSSSTSISSTITSTSISSQCQLFNRKINSEINSEGKISNSQEIVSRSGLSPNSNSKKRKRRSTLNEKDMLDEPESKRPSLMNTLNSIRTFIPIASTSTSFLTSEGSHSKTPNLNKSNNVSLPSSVESSSLNSSLSPSVGIEIDEFIEHEMDARSSSSCLSAGAEFDFVPSSDESTLVLESSRSHSEDSHQNNSQLQQNVQLIHQNFITPHKTRALTPSSDIRHCPLPALSWANASDVWNVMCKNDERGASDRTSSMLDNHCGLQSRMRSILLDWLIEVCEVYKLHRETYYLAVDYLDRYLSTQKNVQKTHLQLIGITCLFVAAKVEEIYPPKIGEFAYVTDGACQEEDILQHELLLLSGLDWSITPVTIMGWLGIYMQLNVNNRSAMSFAKTKSNETNRNSCPVSKKSNSLNFSRKTTQERNALYLKENNNVAYNNNNYFVDKNLMCNELKKQFNDNNIDCCPNSSNLFENDSGISIGSGEVDDTFIYPQFSGYEFSQTAQLIDLCTLDLGLADFSYSVIAAAAMSYTFGRETAVRVSGYEWASLASCANWMEPFFDIIKEEAKYLFLSEQNEQVQSKHGLGHFCPKIVTDESHMIQSHTTSITMLEKVLLRREQLANQSTFCQPEVSPAIKTSMHIYPDGLLTPPASSRKPISDEDMLENEIDLQRT